MGVEAVPVGHYTQAMLERAREELGGEFVDAVAAHVVSKESNVRLVRAKVELGEADAAIVYRSDITGSSPVAELPIPEALHTYASYPIARVRAGEHPAEAQLFIDYLLSHEGQSTLAKHGFEGARP